MEPLQDTQGQRLKSILLPIKIPYGSSATKKRPAGRLGHLGEASQSREAHLHFPRIRMGNASKGSVAQIEHPTTVVRSAISHLDDHAFAIALVRHAQLGAKRQMRRSSGEAMRIEAASICCSLAVVAVTNAVMRSVAAASCMGW